MAKCLTVPILVAVFVFCFPQESKTGNTMKSVNRTVDKNEEEMSEMLPLDLWRGDSDDPERLENDGGNKTRQQLGYMWSRFRAWERSRRAGYRGGATYVRWGRKVCPEEFDTELVYNGVAGGGFYDHMGSGSNLICLTRQPEFHNYTDAVEGLASIYGTEYQTGTWFGGRNGPSNLDNNDVPCAVCRARPRTSMIMIPGRKSCHGEGWTREYWGYLATGRFNHQHQIQYVCVDEAPEVEIKGYSDNNGALLYVVEGICGSLPCPPYGNGWELTCTVCTK